MRTVVLKPSDKVFEKAKNFILEGQCVAFPTGCVYGIGANCFSDDAVKKIYSAKECDSPNMMVLLVPISYPIENLVEEIPADAKKLMDAFWPGELTILFKNKNTVSRLASAYGDVVGIRVPSDPVAHRILVECGLPLATPSANITGRDSPINADEVLAQLVGRIPMIIDGGPCENKTPSTVVDATGDRLEVVRLGTISEEEIRRVLEN